MPCKVYFVAISDTCESKSSTETGVKPSGIGNLGVIMR